MIYEYYDDNAPDIVAAEARNTPQRGLIIGESVVKFPDGCTTAEIEHCTCLAGRVISFPKGWQKGC